MVRRASIGPILVASDGASIAQVATASSAPLVVTGRTHHGMVERLLRRETPLGIVRRARVPVLPIGGAD